MHPIIRKTVFATLFAALGGISVLGSQAIARDGAGAGSQGSMGRFADVVAELNLTDDQKADLVDLKTSIRDRFSDARTERSGTMRALVDAITADHIDRTALHTVVDTQAAARIQATHATVDDVLDFYENLDATQQALVKERAATFCEHRGQGQGQGQGHGRGGPHGQGRGATTE